MKTTVEIPNALLEEARKWAIKEGVPIRALIEQGLRHLITEGKRAGVFRLRKATFKGKGLQPEFSGGSWEKTRDRIYKGQGG